MSDDHARPVVVPLSTVQAHLVAGLVEHALIEIDNRSDGMDGDGALVQYRTELARVVDVIDMARGL